MHQFHQLNSRQLSSEYLCRLSYDRATGVRSDQVAVAPTEEANCGIDVYRGRCVCNPWPVFCIIMTCLPISV
jgi:hypothetical protein